MKKKHIFKTFPVSLNLLKRYTDKGLVSQKAFRTNESNLVSKLST